MRPVLPLLLCLTMTGLLVVPTQGTANDGPVQMIGGSASPKSPHPTIRMDSEEVTIRLHKKS